MAEKLSAAVFAKFVKERAQAKDGYIMGSRGQDPKKWAKNSWWFTQYKGSQKKKALYWRENAQRVWDCQGLAEGYIKQETGSNIDVRARNNYSSWCDPKGKGKVPEQYRMPGTAVFIGSPATHVGYLIEPVDAGNPAGDWIVGEARGVMYGTVLTKLNSRGWTHWGLMTKYFSYEGYEDKPLELGDRTLSKGMTGADVQELQSMLIGLGYDLGKWGADGDFGSDTQNAVKKFQKEYRLTVDGIAGPDTIETLKDAYVHEDEPPEEEEKPEDKPQEINYEVDALDLSSWNSAQAGKIDWEAIKNKVGFLILRAGITRLETKPLGVGPDEYFERWAKKCNEYGIPFWVYYYSQGKTLDKARQEAEYLYNIASPYNPVGYVLDCEEKNIKVAAFFARLYELGAKKTMLYIGHNWYPVYDLAVDEDGFVQCCDAVWIPRYGKNDGTAKAKYLPKYPCDLWQYSSVFRFSGIPDKTLDVNKITGQRRTMAWFRGEN